MRASIRISAALALISLAAAAARAGEAGIEHARFEARGGSWQVSVTLRHGDTGWDHYADAWRVVTEDGTVLGTRTLYHPHVNEQPFTRSLGGVKIPEGAARVYVEAHDSVHGWNRERLEVDFGRSAGDRFAVER